MPAYEALYRKWRPQTFDDIVAQPHITRTLVNQILRDKTAHAYLFTGSRGTGKTTCARIFAKAVNCLHPKNGNPCLECEICRDAEAGALTDIIEIDGASNNGVDEVRSLRDNAAFMPVRCKYKVYIIDEVHMMSAGAFNALLKMIEEPPAYVKFVFATTEIHKVPATILSRCQRFDFRRILPNDIAGRIQYIADHEEFSVSDEAALRIASLADGGMRDALSLLDQCAAVSDDIQISTVEEAVGVAGKESVFSVLGNIAQHDASSALGTIDALYRQSKDMTRFADELSQQLRSLMLLKTAPNDTGLLQCMPDDLEALRGLSEQFTMPAVLEALDAIRQCCDRMTRSGSRRMELEMTLIRLCTDLKVQQGDTSALSDRIAKLEAQLADLQKNGIAVNPSGAAQKQKSNKDVLATNLQTSTPAEKESLPPVKNWAVILEEYDRINPSVTGLLSGSEAYYITKKDGKEAIHIVVKNRLFTKLFSKDDAIALGGCISKILGKRYGLGISYADSDKPQTSPVDVLLQRAKESGMDVSAPDANQL